MRESARTQLSEAPRAESMPAYRRFLIDAEGNAWVRDLTEVDDAFPRWGPPALETAPSSWTVVGPDGVRATVALPPEFGPFQITSDTVLGVQGDAAGVDRVVTYALNKRLP